MIWDVLSWACVVGLVICGLGLLDTETRPLWRALGFLNLLLAMALALQTIFF